MMANSELTIDGHGRARKPAHQRDAALGVLASLPPMAKSDSALSSLVVDGVAAHRTLIKTAVSNEMVVAREGPGVSFLRSAGWRDGLFAPVIRVRTVKDADGQISLESKQTTELTSAIEAAKWASELAVLAAVAGTLWLILAGPGAGVLADLLGGVLSVGVGVAYVFRFLGRRRRRISERRRMAAVVNAVLSQYSVQGARGYRRELPGTTTMRTNDE